MERTGIITMKGAPLTLTGSPVAVGNRAPDFTAVDTDLNQVRMSDYKDKILIISSVPSLDTPVCDLQTRRFNREAENIGEDVAILTLSMDLPFAQKRWCGSAGAERVITLSDHRTADFGEKYGLLIKELRLLARAVMIIDQDGIIRYIQIVPEIATEPDYEDVLEHLKKTTAATV